MGLAIPWAILAAMGVAALVGRKEKSSRNLATVLGIIVMCGSSIQWTIRETKLSRDNVSNTVLHTVYLGTDARKILHILRDAGPGKVVLAIPGIKNPEVDADGKEIPDRFATPEAVEALTRGVVLYSPSSGAELLARLDRG